MTREQLTDLAIRAGMTVDELTTEAMLTVMLGDPTDPRYTLANAVWRVGQEIATENKQAKLHGDGWVYYAREDNDKPMCCPNGHEAHLTGGKHPRWSCRQCDMMQVDYEDDGANGYALRWALVH